MAEERESYYAAACEHLAAAAGYLARLAPLAPHPFVAPHTVPALQLATGPLPHVGPLPRARPPQPHRRGHRLRIREQGEDEDDDEEEDEHDDDGVIGGDGGAIADGGDGGADLDDDAGDFAFVLQDLLHGAWPLVAAAAPYPLHKWLPDEALQSPAWTWYLFVNAMVFTAAVTFFAIIVFGSSRRFLPTFLRAVVLAVTVGAEVAAAVHLLPPDSLVSTILSYVVVFLHIAVFIFASIAMCRRRRLHPLP